MKALFKRSVCLWLSMAVLLGSVGLTVREHICLISGQVMLTETAGLNKKCCKKDKPAENNLSCEKPSEKKDCCTLKTDQHKLEIAAQTKLTQFSFVWITQDFAFLPTFQPEYYKNQNQVLHYSDSSPPLYGKELLYSLHILRV